MDLPQAGDGTLAHPTRARVFAFLVEKRGAVGTEEVAGSLGLHPNGVRRHLERLQEEGLVERSRVRAGQGRPRDSWTVAPEARPEGVRPRAYADLSRWLVRTISGKPSRVREVERAGREIGRELAPAASGDPIEAFRQAFTAMGFEPHLEKMGEGAFSCCLGNCPYRDSVRENADVVCGLHRGLTVGLLAELDPKAKLVAFEPHDPERAGCRVEVSRAGGG